MTYSAVDLINKCFDNFSAACCEARMIFLVTGKVSEKYNFCDKCVVKSTHP